MITHTAGQLRGTICLRCRVTKLVSSFKLVRELASKNLKREGNY